MLSGREARSLTIEMRKAKSSSKSPSRKKSPSRNKSESKKSPEKSRTKSPSKSPARPAKSKSSSPSRNKSPARKKSPKRNKSPSRTKSPSRNKSPARKKSPSKTKSDKSPTKVKQDVTESVKRISVLRDSPMSRGSSQRSTTNFTEHTESEEEKSPPNERIIRSRVNRFEERVSEIKRAVAKPLNDNFNKSEVLNNNDKSPLVSRPNSVAIIQTVLALLAIAVLPLITLVSVFSCTKENCKSNVKIPWSSWKSYLHVETSLLFFGFILGQTLISLIPLIKPITGYPASHRNLNSYRCNGILNWVLTIGGVLVARYFKLPLSVLLDRVPHLLAPSLALGLILGIVVYFSSHPDSHAPRSNFFVDFVFGKSSISKLGPIDFKLLLNRLCLLSIVTFLLVLAIAEIDRKANYTQYSYSLLAVCFMHVFYASDYLLFESDLISSYFMQQERLGYFYTFAAAVWPFSVITQATFLYYNKIPDNKYLLALTFVLFTVGYLLHRIALHQKSSFRKQPKLYANSDVVVSREGRNLLAGGLWGFLRHPNYLGCLLMYWSFVPLVYLHWPALILPAIITVELMVRIYSVEQHCKQTHATAWSYYTTKVPYRLVPYVY